MRENGVISIYTMESIISYAKEKWVHAGFQKYLRNTGWMFAAKIATFFTSFLTVAIVARYLGPENLGKLDYAQSFVAIISVFASLGIDQILYRDLISHPERENLLLGTAIFSKLFFGTIAFFLSITISYIIGNDLILTILIGLCATTFIISPIGTIGILFNAHVKTKYNAQVSIFLAFFIPALKISIVFLDKGIIFFAATILIEALISMLWSLYIYTTHFHNNPLLWRFDWGIFQELMRNSWPLLLAGFSGYIYAKIDQVLILHYMDSATVGIYGVAVKLTQIWAFLPGLIITSLFPAIINARNNNFVLYANRFKKLSLISILATIIIAVPLYVFAPFIIKIIFGEAFMAASPVLRIYLWTSIAITLVVLSQHYLIAEKLNRIFLYTSIIGAVINILLNIILIPAFGAKGSAVGTLISYISVFISLFIFKKSRNGILRLFILSKLSK